MINQDPDVRFLIRSGSDFGYPTLTFQILVRDPALGPLLEEYRSDSSELGPVRQAEALKQTLDELAKLKRREEKAIQIAERRLASIGTTLFRELPDKLQDRLWWLVGRAETFQILSNELSIPWELMMLQKPRSSDGRTADSFAKPSQSPAGCTRWLGAIICRRVTLPSSCLKTPAFLNLSQRKLICCCWLGQLGWCKRSNRPILR
jgi:hypothetical protein